MPEPTPADALERMRRQVRAVRWRQNLHELQGALYRLLATLAAAAAALVVLALLRPPIPAAAPANPRGRIAVARRGRPPAAGRRFAWLRRPAEDDSALSRLPGALQERIQDRLWGEDREGAREALERAELGMSAERE